MIARYPPLARVLYRDYDYVESLGGIAIYKRRADAPPPLDTSQTADRS
jgi:hypothetical protein